MTSPTLTVRDLRVTAQSKELVHGVSFDVAKGERLGIIGASGSGKTLACMAIAGLIGTRNAISARHLSVTGSVRLSRYPDVEIVGSTERKLVEVRGDAIGMIFQEPMTALNPVMKVGSQVAEALSVHKAGSRAQARATALELLRQTELPNPQRTYRSYPHQLSGGQQQRVVAAIALANAPSLLICDEPTTALDVTVQARLLQLISDRADSVGASMLFISHDLAVVASVCERILVMYDGEVVESGTVPDILGSPQHFHTQELLANAEVAMPSGGSTL